MVLDSPPRHAYQQQSYSAAQTGYSYPQASSGYNRPSMGMEMGGMGYNPTQLPNNQYQSVPMGYGQSQPHGQGYASGKGYQHQNQHNGMSSSYSSGAMGYGGNHSLMGQGYGPSYTSSNYSAYKEIDD